MIDTSTVWQIDDQRGLPLLRKAQSGPPPVSQEFRDFMQASGDRSPLRYAGEMAVIDVSGLLTKRRGMIQWFYGNHSTQEIGAALAEAVGAAGVSGIMLRIDSPGGTVDGLTELSDAVHAARKVKPVVAQVSGLAASAAYRVASQASAIYAGRSDLIGSIGTLSVAYDTSKMAEREGVEAVVFSTGFMKGAGVPGTPLTDEQRAEMQRVVDRMQQDFEADLKRGRGLTEAQIKRVATGQVWQADEALTLRLIDGVQSEDETVADLGRRSRAMRRDQRARQGQVTTIGALQVRIAALQADGDAHES